jgi:hypothetical protein
VASDKELALYEKLFLQDLEVSPEYLGRYADKIRARLRHAAEEFKTDHANMFAINMCLHAASSIILSHPERLNGVLDKIRKTEVVKDKDATLVLTVSSLCYLVEWDAARAAKEETNEAKDYYAGLEQLRRGFDEINWLIGEPAMKALGMSKLPLKIQPAGTPVDQRQQGQKQQIAQQ